MRIRTIGQLALGALVLSACGSAGGQSASLPRPPNPVNLTVFVNDSRVSVSPTRSAPGRSRSSSPTRPAAPSRWPSPRGGSTLASTAPINPQGTTQVSVDFKPGRVHHQPPGRAAATTPSVSKQSSIRPASIHIGRERESSGNDLLQP